MRGPLGAADWRRGRRWGRIRRRPRRKACGRRESPQNEAKRLIKQIYGLNIDNKMAQQNRPALLSKNTAARSSLAVRDPDMRQMLNVYAAGTGQKMPLSSSDASRRFVVQSRTATYISRRPTSSVRLTVGSRASLLLAGLATRFVSEWAITSQLEPQRPIGCGSSRRAYRQHGDASPTWPVRTVPRSIRATVVLRTPQLCSSPVYWWRQCPIFTFCETRRANFFPQAGSLAHFLRIPSKQSAQAEGSGPATWPVHQKKAGQCQHRTAPSRNTTQFRNSRKMVEVLRQHYQKAVQERTGSDRSGR